MHIKFNGENFLCEIIGTWPVRSNHSEKRNGVHMCQIKPDETRNVLILLSGMHIHIWEPEGRKDVIFNLDFAITLLIWIFSSTSHEPSLNRRSCLSLSPTTNNQRSRSRWDICHFPLVPFSQL